MQRLLTPITVIWVGITPETDANGISLCGEAVYHYEPGSRPLLCHPLSLCIPPKERVGKTLHLVAFGSRPGSQGVLPVMMQCAVVMF
jgi:hypothetical protein